MARIARNTVLGFEIKKKMGQINQFCVVYQATPSWMVGRYAKGKQQCVQPGMAEALGLQRWRKSWRATAYSTTSHALSVRMHISSRTWCEALCACVVLV